jgi:hypothetical protein
MNATVPGTFIRFKRLVLPLLATMCIFLPTVCDAETNPTLAHQMELIWDASAPKLPNTTPDGVRGTLLKDGDVLLDFSYRAADGAEARKLISMFLKRDVDLAASKLDSGHVAFADGTASDYQSRSQNRIVTSAGGYIASLTEEYRRCFRGPANKTLVEFRPDGTVANRRVIFRLLEQPKRFVGGGGTPWMGEPDGSCPNEPPLDFGYKVEAVAGSLLPLRDGTFLLLADSPPLVLRLDQQMNSKSLLIGKSVFVFPFSATDSPLFVGKLTHKNYGSIEAGTAQYPQALEDLYFFLTTQK